MTSVRFKRRSRRWRLLNNPFPAKLRPGSCLPIVIQYRADEKCPRPCELRERRTTINHAMKTCRRAWNIAARRNPGKVPALNPFAQMGLRSSDRETPTATYTELQAFRAKAIELGYPSLATAVLISWEWLQRERHVFGTFDVAHYRPKERQHAVRVLHTKTGKENWVPLFDDAGTPLSN